ncbi:DUF692 family multinuclear iron-containing protein [Cystobacter fuscus]|uniref:multinuclear nonheme iron-dependent oxidase n=1 Tax=Cystobacter fuscus TaxID=43 RepID=UPI002B2D2034|nr:DUF692 domain-containing protein [Cystobacter fuscus]
MWSESKGSGLEALGLGLSATPREALEFCARKERGEAGFRDLGYLNIGVASYSDIPEELPERLRRAGLGTVSHLEEFNLVEPDIDLGVAERVARKAAVLSPAWFQEDLGLWSHGGTALFGHMMNAMHAEADVARVAGNIRRLMAHTGMLFLAENAPAYMTVEGMDLLGFLSQVAERADCGLVLDIGHLIGYCVATGRDPVRYVQQWAGIERVVEIHVAGFQVLDSPHGPMWLDDHTRVIPARGLEVLGTAVERASNLKALTLEQDGAVPDVVLHNLGAVSAVVAIS